MPKVKGSHAIRSHCGLQNVKEFVTRKQLRSPYNCHELSHLTKYDTSKFFLLNRMLYSKLHTLYYITLVP